MARAQHKAAPADLEAGDDGTGNADAACRVCGLPISRRHNTMREIRVLERDPSADTDGPLFWYWLHDRRPEDEEAFRE